MCVIFFFFQAEDGIRDYKVTGVQTCALPILLLNEGIGSYTTDLDWTGGTAAPVASRQQAPADLLPRIYSSGLHSNAKNLSQVAIIDLRPELGADIHMSWRSLQQRARLDAGNGGHDNHVIRATQGPLTRAMADQTFADRKSTRLNSSHLVISYAVFCLKKKKKCK